MIFNIALLFARRREFRRLLEQSRRLPRTTWGQANQASCRGLITKQQFWLIAQACRVGVSARPNV